MSIVNSKAGLNLKRPISAKSVRFRRFPRARIGRGKRLLKSLSLYQDYDSGILPLKHHRKLLGGVGRT